MHHSVITLFLAKYWTIRNKGMPVITKKHLEMKTDSFFFLGGGWEWGVRLRSFLKNTAVKFRSVSPSFVPLIAQPCT